jgi:uncharacterized protein
MQWKCIILALAFVLSSTFVWAGFDEGLAAANKGDFKTALREWLPLAKQGDGKAQIEIGLMYSNGEGVLQDDMEAVKWYRLAADQGHALGQSNMGFMYSKGRGVPQDDNEALKWYIDLPPIRVMLLHKPTWGSDTT